MVRFDPAVLERSNMTGELSCIVAAPKVSYWSINEINTSTVILNSTIRPCSVSVYSGNNGTAFVLAEFNKNLLGYVFNRADSLKYGMVTFDITGRLKNGDYFAGSDQLRLVT